MEGGVSLNINTIEEECLATASYHGSIKDGVSFDIDAPEDEILSKYVCHSSRNEAVSLNNSALNEEILAPTLDIGQQEQRADADVVSSISVHEHQAALDEVRKSFDGEILRLQNLLTMTQQSVLSQRSSQDDGVNDATVDISPQYLGISNSRSDMNPELEYHDFTCDPLKRIVFLEKEIKTQESLLNGFQKENVKLFTENKDLKKRLALKSCKKMEENATAERLARENSILNIELNQVKSDLQNLRTLHNGDKLLNQCQNYEHKISCLNDEYARTKKELREVKTKNSELREELDEKSHELSICKSRCSELSKILHEYGQKVFSENTTSRYAVKENNVQLQNSSSKFDIKATACNPKTDPQKQLKEFEVALENPRTSEENIASNLKHEFEILKSKYEDQIRMLESEIEELRSLRHSMSAAIPEPRNLTIRDNSTEESSVPGRLKLEVARQQQVIEFQHRQIQLLQKTFAELSARSKQIDPVVVKNERSSGCKQNNPERIKKSRRKSSLQMCRNKLGLGNCLSSRRDASSNTDFTAALIDVCCSPITAQKSQRNIEIQTIPSVESSDGTYLKFKCKELETRNSLLTAKIASANSQLRGNEKIISDLRLQIEQHAPLIKHLKSALATERIKNFQQSLTFEYPADTKKSSSEKYNSSSLENKMSNGSTTVRDLRCELNLTKQLADRLQIQLDTLRHLHLASIRGQPPMKAIERLFTQLNALEREQEAKNRYLEQYISFRLLEAHTTGECPCADEAVMAVNTAAYWRQIAEQRASEVSRLGQEMDKLISLLSEISESTKLNSLHS